MPDLKIAPFPVGMDQLSSDVNLPAGAVRDAKNVEIDRQGHTRLRRGRVPALVQPGMHSLWAAPTLGYSFVMAYNILNRAELSNNQIILQPIATLLSGAPVSYDELNGEIIFSNRSSAGIIRNGATPRSLGVPAPSAVTAAAASGIGGLHAGSYSVVATFLRGNEESAACARVFVGVPANGAFNVTVPAAPPGITGARIYVSHSNSENLYRFGGDVTPGSTVLVNAPGKGRQCDTEYLDLMPRGDIIRVWRGRVLIARDGVLYVSEPMRYGLYSPTEGFVQEASRIIMVEPVDGGVFVATRERVMFYSGDSPKNWTRTVTNGRPVVAGASRRVPQSDFAGQLGAGDKMVALWLAENGFVVGLPDGSLSQPQSSRIKISRDGKGALAVSDRRALATIV